VDELVVPPERLLAGIKVELEHADVTHGDLLETAKIALAHFKENPGMRGGYGDYYHHLEKMEEDADEFWSDRVKPDIYVPLMDLLSMIDF